MNREAAIRYLPFITGLAEGKQIQYLDRSKWVDINVPNWNKCYQYRIKPEPKYRPFNSSELQSLLGKVIVSKAVNDSYVIIFSSSTTVGCNGCCLSPEVLLERWTFGDGSPCGVLDE